ncbi:MAG TPA: aconitate hydratase AcnA, partial [Chloroflexota bacterium]|nr:aconitate hydratase AcnA [Chloroflexota bacterium]
ATDLVLTVTEILRKKGVVGKFVEFTGPGLSQLGLADRATLANMSPEYGATAALFPIDAETLRYLAMTGRDPEHVAFVERYAKAQGLFRTDDGPEPVFDELIELDLATVEPSVAGPRRPQDRVPLARVRESFQAAFADRLGNGRDGRSAEVQIGSERVTLGNGAVVIAAITSCTNTSNPMVMVGAGLLAKRAVERGLRVKPTVKTSMAPGSKVVTDYLERAGLLPYLEALGFHVVGYGCTTCIGNSGPLPAPVAEAIRENDLVVAAVLSGNRNFEARIHPQVRASYLASPPLVVAYGLAGTIAIDLTSEPIGFDPNGEPVYLRDIWPSPEEVREVINRHLSPEMFKQEYARVFEGDERWRLLPVPEGDLFHWDPASTYVREPPFFEGLDRPAGLSDIRGARVLALLGDSVTTDHISPAGAIPPDSPAGRYLIEHGVEPRDFNSYGARRGNHEVMIRGTFANVRLRNHLVPGREGDWTVHFPTGEVVRIYDAAMRYREEQTPLLVIAGKEYGSGSSRDWAAKGPALLGVRAVIAESYERIHRSNLIGMGILPLQFREGENPSILGLDGHEVYDILGIGEGLTPGQELVTRAVRADGSEVRFSVIARVDTPLEVTYLSHGGILPTVLKELLAQQ